MRDREKKEWVKLLTQGNTRPLVPKTNKYQKDFFQHKFLASWLKLIQLKGLNLKIESKESLLLYAPEIDQYSDHFLILPFTHQDRGLLGFVVLGQSFISEALHKLLGGADNVETLLDDKALTKLEKKTLESLNGPLQLSLREGIKGLVGMGEVHIQKDWERLDLEKELSLKKAYFCEEFTFQGLKVSKFRIYFRVDAFSN